jgi:transposase
MIRNNLQQQQQQNELPEKAKEIAKLHYKKQVVNETQKKVLADTSSRIQEHIEGDYIKGGSWKTGETKLFLFPQICKELPKKYPERFPDFAQGKLLKQEKYPVCVSSKWKSRYEKRGIEGLSDISRRPHNIKYKKVTPEVEETIIDLRLTKRFGCSRIKFRVRRIIGLSLSTRTIYKILNRHGLNILKCNANTRTYKRFAMRHSNDMVQIDILGPF